MRFLPKKRKDHAGKRNRQRELAWEISDKIVDDYLAVH